MHRKPSIRAVAIVIKDKKVLLMWRRKKGREYYVFPGGHVENNESIRDAVIREVFEETSTKIEINRLLYRHRYLYQSGNTSTQYFYLCRFLSGRLRLGNFNEKTANKKGDLHRPLWVSIARLSKLLLYPLEIRDWLIKDFPTNFRSCPRRATIKIENLRQKR
jgi:ADP-ribose pyrophosphatase YjhB (NUDIX family)